MKEIRNKRTKESGLKEHLHAHLIIREAVHGVHQHVIHLVRWRNEYYIWAVGIIQLPWKWWKRVEYIISIRSYVARWLLRQGFPFISPMFHPIHSSKFFCHRVPYLYLRYIVFSSSVTILLLTLRYGLFFTSYLLYANYSSRYTNQVVIFLTLSYLFSPSNDFSVSFTFQWCVPCYSTKNIISTTGNRRCNSIHSSSTRSSRSVDFARWRKKRWTSSLFWRCIFSLYREFRHSREPYGDLLRKLLQQVSNYNLSK